MVSHPGGLPPVFRAAAWMLFTIVSFLAMAVAARQLSESMSTFEILFFRSLIGLLVLSPLLLKRPYSLRTQRLGFHIGRNIVHFGGQFGWVLGISLLPLAEVFALEFTTPIWVTVLAALLIGERLSKVRLFMVIAGFIGVLIILRPGLAVIQPATFIVLGAALCFAGSVVMVKKLTRTDTALAVVFYMTVVQMPIALVPALFVWVSPSWPDLPWLVVIGITALSAHYAMARALTIADACVIFPIDFLRLPAVAWLGYVLYSEAIDIWTFVGAAVIFSANYYGILQESKTSQAHDEP